MTEDEGVELLDRLEPRCRRLLERCGTLAVARGEHAYLVGGTVRDLLLGRPATDLDVVVEGEGMALAQALARDQGGRLTRHHAFQTARVDVPPEEAVGDGNDGAPTPEEPDAPGDPVEPDGPSPGPPATASLDETPPGWVRIDVATARREEYRSAGELPQVVPGTLQDDLERRDFTVNTLAVALDPDRLGELIDPFDGGEALEDGRIEVLHSRSFTDDPTRILRALRFAERLGYRLEPRTADWLEEAVGGGYLDRVSGDRVHRELRYLFEEQPVAGPPALERYGVLSTLQPGLEAAAPVLQALEASRAWFRDRCGAEEEGLGAPGWSLVLAACARSLESQARWDLVRRLALTRDERRPLVETGVPWHDVQAQWCTPDKEHEEVQLQEEAPSRLESRLRPLATETLVVALAFLEADGATLKARAIRCYLTRLRHVRPLLDGADLLTLGVREGPVVGELLERLRAARLDGRVQTRGEEESLVREWLDPDAPGGPGK